MSNLPRTKGLGSASPHPRAGRRPRLDRFDLAAAYRLRRDLDVGARARRLAGRRPRACLDWDRRRLHRRSAAVSGLDPRRFAPSSGLQPFRPSPDAGRLLPARRGLSGGLSALGVVPWLSLLLWKPVAVVGCFFAVRAYVHGSLTGLWSRRIGTRSGAVLRFVHRGLRLVHRARGSVSGLPLLGLHVRAAGHRRDRRRDRGLRTGSRAGAA